MIHPSEALASTPSGPGQPGSSGNTPPAHYEYFLVPSSELLAPGIGFDVVFNDPRLNSDGEALYRFLLSTSAPFFRMCVDRGGVESFSFCIDIKTEVPAVQWSVADDDPVYRGRMSPEVEGHRGRRFATIEKQQCYYHSVKTWESGNYQDLPPLIGSVILVILVPDPVDTFKLMHVDGLRSSKTLRQWANEYCASPKRTKEFVYKKIPGLFGWNLKYIEDAIRSTIESSGYSNSDPIEIHFKVENLSNVIIRSKASSPKESCWLSKYFDSNDGRWEVCGAAYFLKQWVPTSQRAQGSTRYMETPTGPKKLLGEKEGEWFRKWEPIILEAVEHNHNSTEPLKEGVLYRPATAYDLDGYNETY